MSGLQSGSEIARLASVSTGSRKRVREGNGALMASAEDGTMRDASPDEDEYADVDMEQEEVFDALEEEVEAQRTRSQPSNPQYVPYYPHLGGDDFDDRYA